MFFETENQKYIMRVGVCVAVREYAGTNEFFRVLKIRSRWYVYHGNCWWYNKGCQGYLFILAFRNR